MSSLQLNPDVIFIQKYHQYYGENFRDTKAYQTNKDYWENLMTKRDFYACSNKQSFNSIISYMTRKSACDKTNLDYEEDYRELLIEEGKEPRDITKYMGERPGSTGLFNSDGEISKKAAKDLRKDLASLESTIFEGVLSFSPEFSEKYVNNKVEAYKLLNEVMPKYFVNKGLNPSDMVWFAAYHTNTDNKHCHIVFYEKPGAEKYRELHFNQNDFDRMKEFVVFKKPLTHEYETAREPVIAALYKAKENGTLPKYYGALEPVREIARRKSKFGYCSKEEKGLIRAYMDFIYRGNPDFREAYDRAIKLIDKAQLAINKLYTDNGIKPTEKALKFAETRKTELDWRVCNKILALSKTDMLLNDSLTSKARMKSSSEAQIRQAAIIDKNLKDSSKADKYKGLSFWSKQGIFCLRDGYHETMGSRTLWSEMLQDRAKELQRLKQTKSLSEEDLLKEQEKLQESFERL